MDKRTMTMNWDGLGDIEDDDRFFETYDRISSAVSIDLASSGSDDEDFDDSRISFASALSSASYLSSAPTEDFRNYTPAVSSSSSSMVEDYNLWMAEPGSIKDRRKRLLQGMGLSGDKELLRLTSAEFKRAVSTKVGNCQVSQVMVTSPSPSDESKQEPSPSPLTTPIMLVRSRSDGDIDSFSANTKKRKEELIGTVSKQHLTRTYSAKTTPCGGMWRLNQNSIRMTPNETSGLGSSVRKSRALSSMLSNSRFGAFFLIKNLIGKSWIGLTFMKWLQLLASPQMVRYMIIFKSTLLGTLSLSTSTTEAKMLIK